jgi:hypothetical protein
LGDRQAKSGGGLGHCRIFARQNRTIFGHKNVLDLLKQSAAALSADDSYSNQAILDAKKVLVFIPTSGIISVALLFFDFIFIFKGRWLRPSPPFLPLIDKSDNFC